MLYRFDTVAITCIAALVLVASGAMVLARTDAAAAASSHQFKFNATDLSVAVPDGIDITARKNLPDFDVYDFSRRGHRLLSAYVGNNPDFHMFSYHSIATVDHRRAGEPKITDIRYRTTLRGATREVLVSEERSGIFVHFFYETVPVELANEADQVIASVRVTAPSVLKQNPRTATSRGRSLEAARICRGVEGWKMSLVSRPRMPRVGLLHLWSGDGYLTRSATKR